MAYDYTATPLDAIISGIGDPNNFVKDHVFSRFSTQRRGSDLNVTRTFLENTPFCLDSIKLNTTLAKIERADQPLYVDYFGSSTPTTPNTLEQINFGGGKTIRFQVVIGDVLTEKMEVSRENLIDWDYLGSNSEPDILKKKWAAVKMNAFMEMYINLCDKIEAQAVLFLNSEIALGGGAGTIYPAGAVNTDVKEIPLSGASKKYNGILTEAIQNKFLATANEKPYLLSSTAERMDYTALDSLGRNNSSDEKRVQLDSFEFRNSNSLDAGVDTLSYSSNSFLIKKGGIALTTWTQQMGSGVEIPDLNVANKKFDTFEVPDIGAAYDIDFARGLGGLKFNYYENRDVIDSNATYGTEESFLNTKVEMTLWTRPVLLRAQSEVVGDTPIILYGQNLV